MLAATVRVTRDLDLAEESVQDAYVQALESWNRDGIPERPGAWLTTTARRRALNALARGRTLRSKLPMLIEPEPERDREADRPAEEEESIPDDRLRLIFCCCNPALAREARLALTLRYVCGIATDDIAHMFLVPKATLAARLTRAKKKIAAAGIPFSVPPAEELAGRVDAVLTVIHLLVTTAHSDPSGDQLTRADLGEPSLDLARMLNRLLPEERETAGMLALALIHHSRRDTRTDESGSLILLREQDRTRWDPDEIAEADRLIVEALRAGPPGRFTLQAAIASIHAHAPSHEQTDWPQIVVLYDELRKVWPTPVIDLNRAVAVSMVEDPEAGLTEIERIESAGRLDEYPYLHAAKAELLTRAGRPEEAADSYRRAIALTGNTAEREHLAGRLAELER
ncbi:MAG TPA: sigma-70 family RNA polymerase sigma factor [Solirubrobacterales bacterium]|nr:sigma-70 family RNA polymerase sigma factor [Solirubrobacterales bacterium]